MNLFTRILLAALDVRLERDLTGFTLEMGRGDAHRGIGLETAFVGRMGWHPRARELKVNGLRLAAWGPAINRARCPDSSPNGPGHAIGDFPDECNECARWNSEAPEAT
jgi:hypothetical protein